MVPNQHTDKCIHNFSISKKFHNNTVNSISQTWPKHFWHTTLTKNREKFTVAKITASNNSGKTCLFSELQPQTNEKETKKLKKPKNL